MKSPELDHLPGVIWLPATLRLFSSPHSLLLLVDDGRRFVNAWSCEHALCYFEARER